MSKWSATKLAGQTKAMFTKVNTVHSFIFSKVLVRARIHKPSWKSWWFSITVIHVSIKIISDTAGLHTHWTHTWTRILASRHPVVFSVGFPWQTISVSSCQHRLFLLSSHSLTSNLPWMLTTALALGLAPVYWLHQTPFRTFHVPFQRVRVYRISLRFVQRWVSMHFHFSLAGQQIQ